MKEMIDNKVANGVATKKKYVSPEMEVIDIDYQPKLLVNSPPHRDDTDPDW